MRRREILPLLAGAVALQPFLALAQKTGGTYRVGVLTIGVPLGSPMIEAFRQGLKDFGFVDGQNLVIDHRYAEGRADRLPVLMADLLRGKADVIVTESTAAAVAAKAASKTVPIVMAISGDPVGAGLVDSLARPGANVTGLSLLATGLSQKRVQLLHEAVPAARLLAVVWNPSNPANPAFLRETEAAAAALGLSLQAFEARTSAELDVALRGVGLALPQAFFTLPDGMLLNNVPRIIAFSRANRLPGVYPEREFPEAGALMSYGPSLAGHFRAAGAYVARVLQGAKPADLPIQQPTKFELVVNLKAAAALGLTLAESIVIRADFVIE